MRHRPTVRALVRTNCDGKRKGNEDGGKAPIVLKEDVGIARERSETSILRKEVIQPQVPLRLPCYDFGPVADPTVAGCLLCGLAHRLKVEPTPMPCRAVFTRPGNVFTAACCSAITSDSTFMYSSCRVQSELGRFFGISLLSRVSCPLSPPL